jgi:hypothetical protein
MTHTIKSLRELCDRATPFAMDKDGIAYLPATQHGGIPILPVRRFDIPMSKSDLDFYDGCKDALPLLLNEITKLRDAIKDIRDYVDEQECRGDEDCDHCFVVHLVIDKAIAKSLERLP